MLGRVAIRQAKSIHRTTARSCSFFTLTCDSHPPSQDAQLATKSFEENVLKKLNAPLDNDLIEIKPDGILYFPEIRYRRILNNSFGQGGWALIPRGNPVLRGSTMIREYAMYVNGNFVSQAVGDQTMSYGMSEATAIESAKSTALMRCCKDLGIGNELWDPTFIQAWKENFAEKVWCVNEKSNEKRMLWRRKDRSFIQFPWVEQGAVARSKPAPRSLPKEPVQDHSTTSSSPSPPPPPQFTPPPPPPSAPTGGAAASAPPPPPPQFTPPPAAPAPNKVFSGGPVHVEMSEQVPSSITEGTAYEGKTWKEVVSDSEGRNFLSRACAKPSLEAVHRTQVAEVLRQHIISVRNQTKE